MTLGDKLHPTDKKKIACEEDSLLLNEISVTSPSTTFTTSNKRENGRRPSRRRSWWKRVFSTVKSETKVTYKPYDLDLSTTTKGQGLIPLQEPEECAPKWVVKTTEKDSSLIPTVAISLWLAPYGFLVLVFLECLLFSTEWRRFLLVVFVTTALAQPRDRSRQDCSIVIWYLSIFTIALMAVYHQAVSIFLMALSVALPLDIIGKYGDHIGNWIADQSKKYFALETILEDEDTLSRLSQNRIGTMFAIEPHDILSFGCFAFHPSLNMLPPGGMRDSFRCLVSSAIMNTPILRHIMWWMCCDSVEKSVFRGHLQQKSSIVFVPGGMQEVTLMDPLKPEELVLYLRHRKGFIKIALELGTPVVPVFTFGLDGSYAYHVPRGETILRLSRIMGFLPVLFWGRWGVPFGIPRPQQITVVVGKPIEVPCLGDSIRGEDVDKYHSIYIEELEALFERHKMGKESYRDRKLKIM